MRPADNIDEQIKKLRYKASAETHDRVLGNVMQTLDEYEKQKTGTATPDIWRTIMRSPITKIAAAAGIIIVVMIGMEFFGGSSVGNSVVWADVLEQISTFRPYTCTYTVENEGSEAYSYHLMRLNLSQRREIRPNGTIVVVDLAAQKILMYVPEKKYAIEQELNTEQRTDLDLVKMAGIMRSNVSGDGRIQELGVQEVEGHLAKGFRYAGKYNDITFWADVQTKLPVRVEIIHVGQCRKIINSEFKFDVEFDEALFSTTAPDGYTVEKLGKGDVIELTKFKRSTTEEDLLEGLRAVAVFLGGEFPPEIELSKLQKALRQYIEQNNLSESEVKERLTPVSEKWTKAHWYTRLLRGEMEVRNFHYAGEGVKLGDADKPIVWWLPKDSETYRVIYGDLSVKDVAPENLPR